MAHEANQQAGYPVPSADASLNAVGGQNGEIRSLSDITLDKIVVIPAQVVGDRAPLMSVAEFKQRAAYFVQYSTGTYHTQAMASNAPNTEARAPAPALPPQHPVSSQSPQLPANSTLSPKPEYTDSPAFDNLTSGYPGGPGDSQSTEPAPSATAGATARNASNDAGQIDFGDASRHHVHSRLASASPDHLQQLEQAPAPAAVGQQFHGHPQYPAQSLHHGVFHATHVVNHPYAYQQQMFFPVDAPAAMAPGNPALPANFGFTFNMPMGQIPMGQPQQHAFQGFGAPLQWIQHAAAFPAPNGFPNTQMTELSNVPLNNERGEVQRRSMAVGKKSTAPSVTQNFDVGKENIDPNLNAGVTQPIASSSSSSSSTSATPKLYQCLFCTAHIVGERNEVRQHILEHYAEYDVKQRVVCKCGKEMQIASLPQHILSKQHYGAAPSQCEKCGAEFARGYLLKKHETQCDVPLGSEPAKKKRRIA